MVFSEGRLKVKKGEVDLGPSASEISKPTELADPRAAGSPLPRIGALRGYYCTVPPKLEISRSGKCTKP